MKKTLIFTLIAIIAILAMATSVQAAGNVAKVGTTEYATLELAYAAVTGTNNKIILLDDIVLDKALEINNNVIIDLNGHSITPASTIKEDNLINVLHGGTLTIEDSSSTKTGKISANNMSKIYSAIKMTKAGGDVSKTAKLIVNGGTIEGYYYGINGNGNPDRINTDITINGGTIIGSKVDDGSGIYHPQDGKLTVTGGTIKGASGIEIRSGSLTVTGGTIIATAKNLVVQANGGGSTTIGAGIAIAQHKTENNIKVNVKGGTVQGYVAINESNPQKNTAIDKVAIEVSGGNFEAINGGKEAIKSENKKGFVTGGTFNTTIVEEYLSEEVTAEKDENGEILVGTRYDIEVKETKNGTVNVSSKRAMAGETIEITIAPEEGYELSTIKVLNDKNVIKVVDGKFIMPEGNVVVEAEFKEIVDEDKDDVKDETKNEIVIEETTNEQEKDETPKMGAESVVAVFATIAVISIAGLVILKKKN